MLSLPPPGQMCQILHLYKKDRGMVNLHVFKNRVAPFWREPDLQVSGFQMS